MNISQITSKNNIKYTSFQTLVIRSPWVLTSKVHSKDVKKADSFRDFFAKFCQNYAGVT
jgi:hypothetical protein